jgi:hypothetical protein
MKLVYLPTKPEPHLESFSSPILNLQDTRVTAPFFGPNAWTGILKPVPGGGIPSQHLYVEIKMIFKDGGAYDFMSIFERVKETLHHAVELARESTGTQNVNMNAIHLDDLPAYEEVGASMPVPQGLQSPLAPTPVRPPHAAPQPLFSTTQVDAVSHNRPPQPEPNEPPPDYDEAQLSGVVQQLDNLETSVRRTSHSA